MKYKMKDTFCVRFNNGKLLPYVFNNNGTKIKNILTNEIYDCVIENINDLDKDTIKKAIEQIKAYPFEDNVDKVFTFRDIVDICYHGQSLVIEFALIKNYDELFINHKISVIDEKIIKYFTKHANKLLNKNKNKNERLQDNKEAELSQDF